MKHFKWHLFARGTIFVLIAGLFFTCAGTAHVKEDKLDTALRDCVNYLNSRLPAQTRVLFLNIETEYKSVSEYVMEKLVMFSVNDNYFLVVDRANLNQIRNELDFQYSGEVSDETMVSIGHKTGAQVIISGSVKETGRETYLSVRGIDVESAQIKAQYKCAVKDSSVILNLKKHEQNNQRVLRF